MYQIEYNIVPDYLAYYKTTRRSNYNLQSCANNNIYVTVTKYHINSLYTNGIYYWNTLYIYLLMLKNAICQNLKRK